GFPVLLERTPYDKSAPSRSERTAAIARPQSRAEVAAYFVGHGYAVAYPPSADFPQGFAMNLTEGFLRVRYRDSWERPAPMVPGEVYAITIELFPIANLFWRGHRLRLDISSSNFPHFDVNPNSGEPEGAWQQPRIAHNRVFAEAARPSHVLLPIIPRGELHPD